MPAKNPPYRMLPGSPWAGLGKLIEEAGETITVAARLIGAPNSAAHLSEPVLREKLEYEIADLLASIDFVIAENDLDERMIATRRAMKLDRFNRWRNGEK